MTDSRNTQSGPGEVYFEFTRIGTSLKVTAIDSKTGIEVSMVSSTAYDQRYLESLALKKLRKRMQDLQSK